MSQDDLVFYVKLSIRPEQVQAWRASLDALVDRMAREDAFVSCHLHQDARDPNVFTLYERWREPSVDAFLAHQSTPYRQAYEEALPGFLQHPRETAVLTPLRTWLGAG